jgi:hypothetical protein
MHNSLLHNGERWKAITQIDSGMPVYVKVKDYDTFNRIKKQSKKDYNSLYFHNQIRSLNTRHGFSKSIVSKFKPLNYELPLEGGSITYTIAAGKAFIADITMNLKHKNHQGRAAAGLYQVTYDSKNWKAIDHLKVAATEHIAINGYCKSIDDAAKLLPDFIERGYKENTNITDLKTSGYCLFYNPSHGFIKSDMQQVFDSSGTGTESAKKLMALIETHARQGRQLKWTIHEKGHAVFKKALQSLCNNGRLTPAMHKNLAKQEVFYANPTLNLSVIDHYRKKAGMQLAAQTPLMNNISLTQTWGTLNFISETHISYTQLKEQGENGSFNRTKGHIAANLCGRAAVLSVGSYALPQAISLGAIGWVATIAGVLVSNKPGSNQRVIENTADVINNIYTRAK